MTDEPNMEGWGEATIRTPGAFAKPADMHRVISELFCHDSVLAYQQRSAEGAMRKAVGQVREAVAIALAKRGNVPQGVTRLIDGVLNELDPDHEEWGGYFPSQMLCPLHAQPEASRANGYGRMLPVFSECPGVPWCKAHLGIRVE